jgi:hypothetical protein
MRGAAALVVLLALAPGARAQEGLELVDHEGDLRVVDTATGLATARTIVVSPGVQQRMQVSWRGLPWREALDTWARVHRCEVEELAPDVFWLDRPARIEARFEATSVRAVLERIAALAGVSVLVAPDVQGQVSIELDHVPWREALDRVAAAAGARIVERVGGVLVALSPGRELPPLVVPPPPTPAQLARRSAEPRLTLETTGPEPLEDVAERFGALAGVNALLDPNVRETVPPLVLRGVPWRLALELLARLTRTTVEEWRGGVLVLTQPPDATYAAVGAPAARWFELLAAEGGLQVEVGPIGSVTIDGRLRRVRAEDALVATAETAGLVVTRVERLARSSVHAAFGARERAFVVGPGAAPIVSAAPAAVAPAAAPEPLDLAALDQLLAQGLAAAQADDRDEASAVLHRLSDLLQAGGPARSRAARARVVERWSSALAAEPAFAAAIDLALSLGLGHALHVVMREAVARGDAAQVEGLGDELEALADGLASHEQEEARWFAARFRAWRKLCQRDLAETGAVLGGPLAVTAIVVGPFAGLARAIVNGWVVKEGEALRAPDGAPLAATLFHVLPDRVELRCGDVLAVRHLGGP